MKRTMRMVLCLALVMMLVLPATAFARGKANAPGQVKKAAGDEAVVVDQVPDAEADEPASDKGKPAKADKPRGKPAADSDDDDASGAPGRAAKRTREASGSVETSGTTERKRVGIENAVSRIQRNLERAESRIEAGTGGRIPPGLLSVLEKFMGWLGLAPVGDPEPDPGLDSESDPVQEPTSTVEPTTTVEPTGTPEPEL